jgi:hypothetical protein
MALSLDQLYPGAFGRPTARTGMPKFGAAAKTGSGYALGSSGLTLAPQGAAPIPSYSSQLGFEQAAAPAPQMGMATPSYSPNAVTPPVAPPPGSTPTSGQQYVPPPPPDPGDTQGAAYWNEHQAQPFGGPLGAAFQLTKPRDSGQKMIDSQYEQMVKGWAAEGPIDYSGGAEIGQYYDAARKRQAAMDAAMGRSGGGVGAAGQASLYGQQGAAVANMVRQLLEERRKERLAQVMSLQGFERQIALMKLQREWQKEDSPGFFSQLLGVVGDVAGNFIPGIGHNSSSGPVQGPVQQ